MNAFLKALIRAMTSRNWRCHRRSLFFQNLLKEIKEPIDFTDGNFKALCHDMAATIPFYPGDRELNVPINNFFKSPFRIHITRIGWKWKYKVTLHKDNDEIILQYEK